MKRELNSRRLSLDQLLQAGYAYEMPSFERIPNTPKIAAHVYTDGGRRLGTKDGSRKPGITMRRRPNMGPFFGQDAVIPERNRSAAMHRIRHTAALYKGYSRPR